MIIATSDNWLSYIIFNLDEYMNFFYISYQYAGMDYMIFGMQNMFGDFTIENKMYSEDW